MSFEEFKPKKRNPYEAKSIVRSKDEIDFSDIEIRIKEELSKD